MISLSHVPKLEGLALYKQRGKNMLLHRCFHSAPVARAGVDCRKARKDPN